MRRMRPATREKPPVGLITNTEILHAYQMGWKQKTFFQIGRLKIYRWVKSYDHLL